MYVAICKIFLVSVLFISSASASERADDLGILIQQLEAQKAAVEAPVVATETALSISQFVWKEINRATLAIDSRIDALTTRLTRDERHLSNHERRLRELEKQLSLIGKKEK